MGRGRLGGNLGQQASKQHRPPFFCLSSSNLDTAADTVTCLGKPGPTDSDVFCELYQEKMPHNCQNKGRRGSTPVGKSKKNNGVSVQVSLSLPLGSLNGGKLFWKKNPTAFEYQIN